MDWFEDHVYIAQWVGPFATLGAVLMAIFLPRFLAWRERPRLALEFENSEPYVRTTKSHLGDAIRWQRVRVTNVGGRPAESCAGILTHVSTVSVPRPDVDPIQLRWAGVPRSRGFDAINLSPGDFAFLNVTYRLGDRGFLATFTDDDFDPGFQTWLDLGHGDHHELIVTVTSGNAEPESIEILLRP
jgi:hypothetical protein